MQIMIDISESDFNYIKNHGTEIHPRVYHAFEKAIILSENHGRLIDADTIDFSPLPLRTTDSITFDDLHEIIADTPTVIEADED